MRKLNPLKEKVLEVSNDTFWPYEEMPNIFPVDYFWNGTTEKQLQVHILPGGAHCEYRWLHRKSLSVLDGPHKVPIVTLEGNKAFRTILGSTIFLKGMEMP